MFPKYDCHPDPQMTEHIYLPACSQKSRQQTLGISFALLLRNCRLHMVYTWEEKKKMSGQRLKRREAQKLPACVFVVSDRLMLRPFVLLVDWAVRRTELAKVRTRTFYKYKPPRKHAVEWCRQCQEEEARESSAQKDGYWFQRSGKGRPPRL